MLLFRTSAVDYLRISAPAVKELRLNAAWALPALS
jgi:hypothetical protein